MITNKKKPLTGHGEVRWCGGVVVDVVFVPVADVLCAGLLCVVIRALRMKKPRKCEFMGHLRDRCSDSEVVW